MVTDTSCSRRVMDWSCCQHTQSVHLATQVVRQLVFTEAESHGDQAIPALTLCFGDQSIIPSSLGPLTGQGTDVVCRLGLWIVWDRGAEPEVLRTQCQGSTAWLGLWQLLGMGSWLCQCQGPKQEKVMASICCGLSALKSCLRKHTLPPAVLVLCVYIFMCGRGRREGGRKRKRGGNL